MKADPRRIHELEYELGFRNDPPPPPFENPYASAALLKHLYTAEPGAVIEYDPKYGTPKWSTWD